jgi:hypothetical protein
MDNLNILVEAKREYLEQLCILMCPVMIDVFDEMYQEATKLSKGRKVLMMFQQLLKDVPEWSETMAKQNTDNIANRCAWFRDLVAAVFVSSVKILSAVRLSKDSKKLSVKLPTNEVFIHTCYKNAAKDLYKNPYVFSDNQTEHDRNDKLYDRFCLCVENSVKELIPVQDILQTYMTTQDDMIEPQDANLEEDNVEEFDQPEPEPEPEQEPEPEPKNRNLSLSQVKHHPSKTNSKPYTLKVHLPRSPSLNRNPPKSRFRSQNQRISSQTPRTLGREDRFKKTYEYYKWNNFAIHLGLP